MNNIYTIALNTFRESIRSRILYALLVFAILVVFVSSLFGSVTIGDQRKVVKDFGLFSISLFAVLYAVISGAALLNKELSKKTIYNILSKAVTRSEFVVGKYLGMLSMVAFMTLCMSLALAVYLAWFGEGVDFGVLEAGIYICLELSIVCAAAIFFSSIVVTPLLSGIFTFGVFVAGRSIEYLLYFVKEKQAGSLLEAILTGLYTILPHLNKLNVADYLVQGETMGGSYFAWCFTYTISYSCILLILGKIIFSKREFN